jgi:S-adenosylmethionine:tRNA ribosyltransferase-isomerase
VSDPVPALTAEDFDYALPQELIAQHPAATRGASRLLRLAADGDADAVSDHAFADLPSFLGAGDVLVFNDTRVIKARLAGVKDSGGRVEVLVERALSEREFLAQVRASHPPLAGSRLRLAGAFEVTVIERPGELYRLRTESPRGLLELLQAHGQLPLPPYIAHPAAGEDEERYQTVYARAPGAVAAPTAGLHFDQAMLDALREKGIRLAWLTLHVGAGTFQPVRVSQLSDHHMHAEIFHVPQDVRQAVAAARAGGGCVVAVGTTSLRALEAAADEQGLPRVRNGETDLFITPGYRFQVVDRLITNFHLPKSTLLMLVSAFAGMEPIRKAYAHAIARRYRFFSYGDAMLIDRFQS